MTTTRKRLPPDRPSITHKVEILDATGGKYDLYITVGFYPRKDGKRGQPGELFLKMGKIGSTMRGVLDLLGVQTSMLLQYGVPLTVICKKIRGVSFEPSGTTNNANIPTCTSIADYVFSWLEKEFVK